MFGIRTITGLIVGIILWQYLGILSDDWEIPLYRPTDGIDTMTDFCRWGWRLLGEMVALISSFLDVLDFSILKQSILHLLISVKNLLWSPYYFLMGYHEVISEFSLADQIKIWLGSQTLILVTIISLFYYSFR